MHIRTDRYVLIDRTLNSGPNYWNQDLFPAWADFTTFQYMPGLRMGAGAEPHYHDNDEFWLFTVGRGQVWLDGQTYDVTPNTLIYTPMGLVHRFQMFTDYEVVPAISRLERARRAGHLYPEVDGPPERTVPGFVIPGADNGGPIANRGPRCPVGEYRAITLAAGERVAEAEVTRTEYWLALNGALALSVDGLDVELGPGDLAILRAGAVRVLSSVAGGRVVLARA